MKRSKAVEMLRTISAEKQKAQKKVDKKTRAEHSAILDAFESGLSRAEIESITGFSNPRIGQILAAERIRRGRE